MRRRNHDLRRSSTTLQQNLSRAEVRSEQVNVATAVTLSAYTRRKGQAGHVRRLRDRWSTAHEKPPPTAIVSPVIQPEAADARNTATDAMSSGWGPPLLRAGDGLG